MTDTNPAHLNERDPHELLADSGHTRQDARLLAMAIKRGWITPDEAERRWQTSGLRKKTEGKVDAALDAADSPRDVAALAKVVVAMEAQNQADEHLAAKHDRLDEGKPTEAVKVVRGFDPGVV